MNTFFNRVARRYVSALVVILSLFVVAILAENIETRLYLNMIVTILLFAVIPASFCYMYSCRQLREGH